MTSQNSTLNHVVCINLDVHIWSGRKKLRLEDLKGISNDSIPPETVVSLGSKRIIDDQEIKPLRSAYQRANYVLHQYGVRFMGGYAVPESKLKELSKDIDALRDEFYQAKQSLLNDYDIKLDDWVKRHPGWEDIIRNAAASLKDIDRATTFEWQCFRVNSVPEMNGTNESVEAEAGNLSGRLFSEIAESMQKVWTNQIEGKSKVNRSAIKSVYRSLEKMKSLHFLHPWIGPLATDLEQVMGRLPHTGRLEGQDIHTLMGVVQLLSDTDRVISHGKALSQDESSADADVSDDGSETTGDPVSDETLEPVKSPDDGAQANKTITDESGETSESEPASDAEDNESSVSNRSTGFEPTTDWF